MKRLLWVLALVLFTFTSLLAQSSLGGKWEYLQSVRGGGVRYTIEIKVNAGKVTGQITGASADGTPPPSTPLDPDDPEQARRRRARSEPVLLDGKFEHDIVSFTITTPDRQRKITFTGKIEGDEIELTRKVEGPLGGTNGIFSGVDGPKTISVKRVK